MQRDGLAIVGTVSQGPATPWLAPEERATFAAVLRELNRREIPFLMAGGFVFSHYSGLWRNTKDLDVVVTRANLERAVDAVLSQGLQDYYPVLPYDRSWIYRAYRPLGEDKIIVDVIHQFANHADVIGDSWFAHAVSATFAGEPARFVAPEDLIWMKLMVFQRERCDWPDLFNVIRGLRGQLNWERLLRSAGEHWRLVGALVNVYDWLCPDERHFIPASVREELADGLRHPEAAHAPRNGLFDSRPWFTEAGAGLAAMDPTRATAGPAPLGAPQALLVEGTLLEEADEELFVGA
jgi:hypothetical protein